MAHKLKQVVVKELYGDGSEKKKIEGEGEGGNKGENGGKLELERDVPERVTGKIRGRKGERALDEEYEQGKEVEFEIMDNKLREHKGTLLVEWGGMHKIYGRGRGSRGL